MYVVGDAPRVGRRMRKPQHPFHLRTRAFQIQPFMIAPVLAGETLKNLMMQSRVVTDPIKNPFIGWHKEYYFFYVKLTDLDTYNNPGQDNLGQGVGDYVKMLLADPAYTGDPVSSAQVYNYEAADSQRYVQECLEVVTEHYFTDEAEQGGGWSTLDGLPMMKITNAGLHDSLELAANFAMGQAATDVDLLGDASDDVLTISEVDDALQRWQLAKVNGLTNASYEDYLASFGISQPKEKEIVGRPELVRYIRQWQYPSNTVEPSTGVPSSAVSWSIQERADKDRFFKEPGFLFGVTGSRPKVYLSGQKAYGAGFLNRAEDWMPSMLWGNAIASYKKYAEGTGPYNGITAGTDGYWVDMKDLFLHGDQFVNFALTETNAGLVALPLAASGAKKYPSDTDIDALFVTPDTKQFIREDGVVSLTIASVLSETSPTT